MARSFRCPRCNKRRSMNDLRMKYRTKEGYLCVFCTEEIEQVVGGG